MDYPWQNITVISLWQFQNGISPNSNWKSITVHAIWFGFSILLPLSRNWVFFLYKLEKRQSILSIVYLRNWETHWSRKTLGVLHKESLCSSECQHGFCVHMWISHYMIVLKLSEIYDRDFKNEAKDCDLQMLNSSQFSHSASLYLNRRKSYLFWIILKS